MGAPEMSGEAREKAISAARRAASRAAIDLARDNGAQVISRPAYRGAQSTIQDVEPLAGLRAAREVELGARFNTRNYIRDAREAGHTWQDIGTALDLTPGGEADLAGSTIAEAAYSYAAGSPDTETARRYGRSFSWTCGSCESLISDHGLCNGPADDERGHAQLAATVAAWDAESAEFDAEWEAGQLRQKQAGASNDLAAHRGDAGLLTHGVASGNRSPDCRTLGQGCRYEGSAPVDGHDQPSLAQDLHCMAHGGVSDLVLVGQCPLGWQLDADLAGVDPAGDVIGDLHIRVIAPVRINWHGWHVANIDVL